MCLSDVPFVGREEQLKKLKDTVNSELRPLVTVRGYSGVGKTALVVKAIGDHVEDEGGWFLIGKFDQQTSSQPHSGISIALEKMLEEEYFDESRDIFRKCGTLMNPEQVELVSGIFPVLKEALSPLRIGCADFDNSAVSSRQRSIDETERPGPFRSRKEDSYIDLLETKKNELAIASYSLWKVKLGYLFGVSGSQLRKAFDFLFFSGNVRTDLVVKTTIYTRRSFIHLNGLVAIELERLTGMRKYARKKRYLIKRMAAIVGQGTPGVSHCLDLLEADSLALSKKAPEAVVKAAYEKAIRTASRTGHMHDCATANERCGKYFERKVDSDWANYYLEKALHMYEEWGAMGKSAAMQKSYPWLESSLKKTWASSFRSLERFNSMFSDNHYAEVSELVYQNEE